MVRQRPAGDPAKGAQARGVRTTRGNWNDVWDSFDKRQTAKAANDVPEVEAEGEDMFARAGMAGE